MPERHRERDPYSYRERERGYRERERDPYGYRERERGYRERERDPYSYRERERPPYDKRMPPTAQPPGRTAEQTDEEPPPTLRGQIKFLQISLKKLNKFIERAFPNTGEQIANDLVRWTPPAITVCYILLAFGILASQLRILWGAGYLWGIASLSAIMIGVFFWIWSSNVMKLPDITEATRAKLKRAMRIQSTSFVAAILTIVYFVGMAFGYW